MMRRCVTDEQYGKLRRRVEELACRIINERIIPYSVAIEEIQKLTERIVKPTYNIMVDYTRSLTEMIKAGKYDWVNDDIDSKHLSLKGKGKHELSATLFHFDRYIKSDDAIAKMDKQGYRPAAIEELLALGEKYPDLQREFLIVALGSVWWDLGYRGVPCLDQSSSDRDLGLYRFSGEWDPHCRFLALRK